MKCYNCGDETVFRQAGSVQGDYCEKCGSWGAVTTYISPISRDKTTYFVIIERADYKDLKLIKDISLATGKNYLVIRKLLQQEEVLIYEGLASDVLYITGILKSARVIYKIVPEFKY